jgi:phosphoribosylformylglycinamidine synthase
MSAKIDALVLAGTNCDEETVRALELAGARAARLHLARLAEDPGRLDDVEVLVIAGGFSYGDYVQAGRVFGLELASALDDSLSAFVDRGGLVLGICNGFQVLVETGLLGTGAGPERTVALHGNESDRFECRWIELEGADCACPFVVPGERLPVPVAHAEGRFVVRDPGVLAALVERRQIAYRYALPGAAPVGRAPEYPHNPNGSVDAIAGICDISGRVLGLMPHPERNVTPWNHPLWTRLTCTPSGGPHGTAAREEGEGLAFFRRLVATATEARHRSTTRGAAPARP